MYGDAAALRRNTGGTKAKTAATNPFPGPLSCIRFSVSQAEEVEVKKAKKRSRTRVVRDERGNPIDIRL